jgi:hypothetical protein
MWLLLLLSAVVDVVFLVVVVVVVVDDHDHDHVDAWQFVEFHALKAEHTEHPGASFALEALEEVRFGTIVDDQLPS